MSILLDDHGTRTATPAPKRTPTVGTAPAPAPTRWERLWQRLAEFWGVNFDPVLFWWTFGVGLFLMGGWWAYGFVAWLQTVPVR